MTGYNKPRRDLVVRLRQSAVLAEYETFDVSRQVVLDTEIDEEI